MDGQYDSQMKSYNHLTAQQNATFWDKMGAGAGALGVFTMRMGRVAIPVVRKYILPVTKHLRKILLAAAIAENGHVFAGKKDAISKC